MLTAPLAGPGRSRKKLLIYILIEHQSEPDRLMPLRLADSQLQIFRYQFRQWSQTHRSLARVRLLPVLPVVFYTGLRRWPAVGTLADLIERGDEFRAVTPIVEQPLFLNLPEVAPATLESDGGYLRLGAAVDPAAHVAGRRVPELWSGSWPIWKPCRPRNVSGWRELLSYVGAMVYHERNESEQASCRKRWNSRCRTKNFVRRLSRWVRRWQRC